MTPSIIKQVHAIAEYENMPEGLKISNRANVTLFDASWTAGVDYDENEFDEEINDPDYILGQDLENEEYLDEEMEEMDENELADILGDQYVVNDDENENDENEHYNDLDEDNISNNDADDSNEDNISNNGIEDNNDVNVSDDDFNDHDEVNDHDEDNHDEIEDDDDKDEDYVENNEKNDVSGEVQENIETRRSSRVSEVPTRFGDYRVHLHSKRKPDVEYDEDEKQVLALIMCHFNQCSKMMSKKKFYQMVQTYSLKQGMKKFGDRGKKAAYKEMSQLHKRVVFQPVRVESLTPQERRRAMESLMFLVEKRDKTVKARTCANGSTQRKYTPKDEAASPTAATDSILVTGTIDAKQRRDVMTLDIPNVFVQTEVPQEKGDEKIIMKIRGQLVDMLVAMAPEIYADYVVYENGQKVLYVQMLKALYGMMKASLLYYKKFRKDIEGDGYEVNPYDPCVANKKINGKQHTLT